MRRLVQSTVFLIFLVRLVGSPALGFADDIFLFSKPSLGLHWMEGDSEERILPRQGAYLAPRLSPDGERILFHSRQGGTLGIWLMNLHGEERERLRDGDQANWSPDGERIVFRRNGQIVECELASGRERIASPDGWSSCAFPSYHPDGRILFVSKGRLYLTGADGEPEFLTAGDIRSAPRCSPNGKRIAYQNGTHLFLLDLDSGDIAQLTTVGGVQSWPIWSQDSASLCYCQSPDPFGGPWDIYQVRLEAPQEVHLVIRDVEVSPDWRGLSPPISDTTEVGGRTLERTSAEDAIRVINDWVVLQAAQGSGAIRFVSRDTGQTVAILALDDADAPMSVESVQASESNAERVTLHVRFATSAEDGAKVAISLFRGRPLVRILPSGGVKTIVFRAPMSLAWLPDRLGDDLIFDPGQYPGPKHLLPKAPILMGLSADGRMPLLFITPSKNQSVWLSRDKSEDTFTSVAVQGNAGGIYLAFLPGVSVHLLEPETQDTDLPQWQVAWSTPFPAVWRMAVIGANGLFSRMWSEADFNRMGKPILPIPWKSSGPPRLALLYLYGRSWNTPLDQITLMDVLQDALGVE